MHVAFSPIRNPIFASTQLISFDTSGFNPAQYAPRPRLNKDLKSAAVWL